MSAPETLAELIEEITLCAEKGCMEMAAMQPVSRLIEMIDAGDLITRAEAEAMVRAERDAIAAWHDIQSDAAMGNLHCGSENHEYRHARKTADLHATCAAAIRARGE